MAFLSIVNSSAGNLFGVSNGNLFATFLSKENDVPKSVIFSLSKPPPRYILIPCCAFTNSSSLSYFLASWRRSSEYPALPIFTSSIDSPALPPKSFSLEPAFLAASFTASSALPFTSTAFCSNVFSTLPDRSIILLALPTGF